MHISSDLIQHKHPEYYLKSCNQLYTVIIFILVLFISSSLFARNREIEISRTETSPRIDGILDDTVWEQSVKYGDFVQFDPFNGQPGTENTTVMLTYDSDNLYVAFICNDRQPSQIAASLTPREQFEANDYVSLILDTFNDQRTSYTFTVNPRGVQQDEPGDYLWMSSARITSSGWQAELKIPFKSIRFSKAREQIWGINFERYLFRLKETDYFTHVGRDDVFLDKSAQLTGLSGIKGGKNLEFFPYGGFRRSHSGDETDEKFAGGIDIKYAITSDLTFDITMSPDFSEVESDPFFYQLSPYEYELQENRPFFQESSRYFPGNDETPNLFYSKRIHNPKVAGKLTGKQGKYTVGAVGAINKEENEDETIGAFSLQRDIFKFSKVAVMFSGYSNHAFHNINGSAAFDLQFSQIFSWDGSVQFTHNSDISDIKNGYYRTSIDYEPDVGLNGFIEFERIERNFIPRAGIWRATDLQSLMVHPGYQFRLNKKGIKEIEFEGFARITQTADGRPLGYDIRPFEVRLRTLQDHSFNFDVRFGKNKVQLENDGVLYWHDQYFSEKSFDLDVSYEGNRFYQFFTTFEYSEEPVYNSDFTEAYDGRQIEGGFSLSIRPVSTIKLSFETDYTKQSKKEDGSTLFEGAISEIGFNWQITRYIYFSTRLQHDSYNDRMQMDALFGIELGMGNTLSISYKSRGRMPIKRALTGDEASTFLIKASYLLRV